MGKNVTLTRGLLTLGVVLYALLLPLWGGGRPASAAAPEQAAETPTPVPETVETLPRVHTEKLLEKTEPPAAALTLVRAPEPVNSPETTPPDPEETPDPEQEETPEEAPKAPEAVLMTDGEVTVRVLKNGAVLEMSLREYLIGVLAGEVPGDFSPEALKAQAVAARTCLLYRMLVEPRPNHPEADTCTDPACCNAWLDEAERAGVWNEKYDEFYAAMARAVDDTDGRCLFYGGELILAAYHCASWEATVPCSQVWGGDVPYLQSVFTPEDGETVPDYIRLRRIPADTFWETLRAAYPGAFGEEELPAWETETDGEGRLLSLRLGTAEVTPTRLRQLFSLRSAAFTLEVNEEEVLFRTRGSGHGVGLSQYGAQELALEGWTWQEILGHYYPGAYAARIVLYR